MVDQPDVNAVSVKLPSFWCNNPRAWFVQADAQFAIRQIVADDTKYWHVVAALDQDTAVRCTAFLEAPPANDRYDALKKFLISSFDLSDDERADRILDIRELGDRRPSELVDAILQLNGRDPQHFLLRRIFMRALPTPLRNALATSKSKDLRELGREADGAMPTTQRGGASVCSVEPPASSAQPMELDAVGQRRPRQLCFFHQKFGKRARQCVPPCDWKPFPPYRSSGNAMGGSRK